jgi:hypothetical protein
MKEIGGGCKGCVKLGCVVSRDKIIEPDVLNDWEKCGLIIMVSFIRRKAEFLPSSSSFSSSSFSFPSSSSSFPSSSRRKNSTVTTDSPSFVTPSQQQQQQQRPNEKQSNLEPLFFGRQSGGEKSVSLMLFLLSLQKIVSETSAFHPVVFAPRVKREKKDNPEIRENGKIKKNQQSLIRIIPKFPVLPFRCYKDFFIVFFFIIIYFYYYLLLLFTNFFFFF